MVRLNISWTTPYRSCTLPANGTSYEGVTAFLWGVAAGGCGKLTFFVWYNATVGALSDWLRFGRPGDQGSVSELLIFPMVPSLDRGQIRFIPTGTTGDIGTKPDHLLPCNADIKNVWG